VTTAAHPTSILVPALHAAETRAGARTRRVLLIALLLSLALHLGLSLWPAHGPVEPDAIPLVATLTELPPPPKPVAAAPAPQPKPKPKRTSPVAAPAPTPAPVEPQAPAAAEATPAADAGVAKDEPAAEAVPEATAAAEVIPGAVTSGKTLPPRVDLAYKVFYGTRGFLVGEAVYRFEHTGSRYRISTIGEARGLAALIMRGQGKLESRGLITDEGLQPLTFRVERGGPNRVETATFDWEAGIVTMHEDKTAALDLPTFDPLALMWQYYFTPPTADKVSFTVATPRRVYRYTMTREATESIEWSNGSIEAERWHRRSDDGKTDAYVWLAQSLRHIPVKMRVSHTDRGTLEVLLDSIRVDETGATVDGSEPKFERKDDPWKEATREELVPGQNSGPAATFPTMTGQ
jgi:hypothetical protein